MHFAVPRVTATLLGCLLATTTIAVPTNPSADVNSINSKNAPLKAREIPADQSPNAALILKRAPLDKAETQKQPHPDGHTVSFEHCDPDSCKSCARGKPRRPGGTKRSLVDLFERTSLTVRDYAQKIKRAVHKPANHPNPSARDINRFVDEHGGAHNTDPDIENIIHWEHNLMSTRSTSAFQLLGKKKFGISASQLTGCTVLVVTSKTAVWFAHFWEDKSMEDEFIDPPEVEEDKKKGKKPKKEAHINAVDNPKFSLNKFNENVGAFVKNRGMNYHARDPKLQQGWGLAAKAGELKGGVKAWILTPEAVWKNHKGEAEEPKQIRQLQADVREILGQHVNPEVTLYDRVLARTRDTGGFANGKALYLYAPPEKASASGGGAAGGDDKKGSKKKMTVKEGKKPMKNDPEGGEGSATQTDHPAEQVLWFESKKVTGYNLEGEGLEDLMQDFSINE